MNYKYYEKVEKEIHVDPCPCCGSDKLSFWEQDRDDSMHWSFAHVKCSKCGHKLEIDGKKINDMKGSGRACLIHAIQAWNSQYARYRNPEADALKNELEKVKSENDILKSVILMNDLYPICPFVGTSTEIAELNNKFLAIMDEYKKSRK